MPLSEQEQRLLDEMERSLYHNDADYVATVGGGRRRNLTVVVLGILAAVAGVILLLLGVTFRQPIVGLVGFVVMFGGALLAIAPPRRFSAPTAPGETASGPAGVRWINNSDGDR